MAKNIIKDIVPPGKTSEKKKGILSLSREEIKKGSAPFLTVDKIRPPEKPKTEAVLPEPGKTLPAPEETGETFDYAPERGGGTPESSGKKKLFWITIAIMAGIALVSVLGFLLTPVLSSAKVFVTLRSDDVETGYEMEAKLDPPSGELGFQVISVNQIEKTKEIPATEEVELIKKAEGPIVIYNAYGSQNQRLIKNTRFESPDGRIYRLTQSVVVPGALVKNGEMTPGSIEAIVTADSPGEQYNIENTDFSIPGFKGDPRYGKFYGRSKPGTPIAGGFAGKKKVAGEKEIESARNELKELIQEELVKSASAQKPANYVMYTDGMFFAFEDGGVAAKENLILKDTVYVSQKGSVKIIIMGKDELMRAIAKVALSDWDGSGVSIPEIEKLDFKLKNKDKINPEEAVSLSFNVSGMVKIIRQIDQELLKTKILGAKKTSFQAVLGEFKNIKKAEAVIKPFWSGKFPENREKIKIFENS